MWKVMKKIIAGTDSEDDIKQDFTSGAKIEVIEEEESTAKNTPVQKTSPRCRTPMGSYIVPEGGKPLTSLGVSCPGPSDYLPKVGLTKQASPQYSLVGRPKRQPATRDIPGPFNYNCSGDMIWKKKKISLKGREKSQFDKAADKSVSVLGKYKVDYHAVGKEGPKFKIGTRPESKIVQGFDIPGPNYRPNSSYWGRGPKKSFGARFKTNVSEGPGPGDYEVPTIHRGPSHSFGIKLPEPVSVQQGVNKFSPAANTYNIGTTIGKAPAISIAGRCNTCPSESKVPCPTTYTPVHKCANDKYKAVTLTYRWFDSDGKTKCCNIRMVRKGDTPKFQRFHSRSEGSVPTHRSPISDAGSVSLPSIRNTSRMSIRSHRSNMASRMLLPSDFDTPGPDSYNIKSTIGTSPAPLFKGDRSRSFEQAKTSNALFLLPRLANATPAPGAYNLGSSIGKGHTSTFGHASRQSRFAGDRNNNAVFLLSKYDDPSPAPTRYNIKSSLSDHGHANLNKENTLAPGATFARAKRDARFAGDKNARFLLPRIIPKNPPPTTYKTEDYLKLGKGSKGSTFGRERRNARFPGDNRAKFLLMERMDQFRRPHSFSQFSNYS